LDTGSDAAKLESFLPVSCCQFLGIGLLSALELHFLPHDTVDARPKIKILSSFENTILAQQ